MAQPLRIYLFYRLSEYYSNTAHEIQLLSSHAVHHIPLLVEQVACLAPYREHVVEAITCTGFEIGHVVKVNE
jgi:hypothetical protein